MPTLPRGVTVIKLLQKAQGGERTLSDTYDGRTKTDLLGVDPSTRTEVRELEPSAQVVGALDQDVFRLYVSMENSLPVHVIQSLQQLVHVASHQLLKIKNPIVLHTHMNERVRILPTTLQICFSEGYITFTRLV